MPSFDFNVPTNLPKARKFAKELLRALRFADDQVVAGSGTFKSFLGVKTNGDVVAIDAYDASQVDDLLGALEANITTNQILKALWTDLLAAAGTYGGQGAEVLDSDAGTHLAATNTGYNGASTPNAGRYSWNPTWARWVWIGATGLSAKANKTTVDAISGEIDGITGQLDAVAAVSFSRKVSDGDPSIVVLDSNVWGGRTLVNAVYGGWQIGVRVLAHAIPKQFVFPVIADAATDKVTLTVYRRPAGVDGIFSNADEVVMAETPLGAEVGLVAGQLSMLTFDISSIADLLDPDYLYGFSVRAKNSGGSYINVNACQADVSRDATPNHRRGYFYNLTSSAWGAITGTTSLAYALITEQVEEIDGIKLDVANLQSNAGVVARSQAGLAHSTTFSSGFGFTAWQVGWRPPVKARNLKISTLIATAAGAAGVYFSVYARPLATGDSSIAADFTGFGLDPTDQLVFSRHFSMASLGLTAGVTGTGTIDVSDMGIVDPTMIYGFTWVCVSATGGAIAIGVGSGPALSAEPDWPRGAYRNGPASGWTVISSTGTVGYTVSYDTVEPVALPYRPVLETPYSANSDDVAAVTGLTVQLPAVTIDRPSGKLLVAAGPVTVDAATSAVVSALAVTLTAGAITANLSNFYRYLGSTVTVVRTSDSAVLVENTDYTINRNRGVLARLTGASNFAATISFTGYSHRYDAAVADMTTGAVSVIKGTDRILDPEGYKPAIPAGKILLFWLYVWRDGVDVVPAFRFRERVHVSRRAENLTMLERNRRILAKVIARARLGQAITFVGHGDSITDLGATTALTAGGATRDLFSFYSGHYPSDTLAGIERFNLDGSPNPAGLHMHLGWNWAIKKMLEKFGSTVTYLNFGIGGSTSANSITSGTVYNGSHPDRLAPILASGAHLLVLAFGMNELGSTATYAQVLSIIMQAQAVGMEVLVVTPPRRNAFYATDLSNWLFTHDELVRAAYDSGAAVASFHEIAGPGNEGACGMSAKNVCGQNLVNHPSPFEMKIYSEYLARIFG